MRVRLALRRSGLAAVLGLLALLAAPPCHAGPLLQFEFNPGSPVIFTANDVLSYNAGTGAFHDESPLVTFISGSGDFAPIFNGLVTIDLQVDQNGDFVASGTGLSVSGDVDIDGDSIDDATGILLSGPITAFGFAVDPAGAPASFNGLFDIQAGALTQTIALSGGGTAAGFPVGGLPGGFLLTAENATAGLLGNFAQDFASDSGKTNIGVAVPEPATMTLALAGSATLAGCGLLRRRRRPTPSI